MLRLGVLEQHPASEAAVPRGCRLQQSQGLLKKLEERIERIHVAGEEAAARRRHEAEQVEEAKAKSRHFKPDIDLRSQVCHTDFSVFACETFIGQTCRHRCVSVHRRHSRQDHIMVWCPRPRR